MREQLYIAIISSLVSEMSTEFSEGRAALTARALDLTDIAMNAYYSKYSKYDESLGAQLAETYLRKEHARRRPGSYSEQPDGTGILPR